MGSTTVAKDGWVLRIERESIKVEMIDPREADPDWRFTDAAGHEHSWNGSLSFEERVTATWLCPDCHEPHEDSSFFCIRCGEEIAPGTRPAQNQSYIAGPTMYYLNDERISEERARELLDG